MLKKSFIIWLPHAIYSAPKLNGNAKLILGELLNLLKVNRRYCWATNKHFSQVFNLQKANVSYHIKSLEKAGWIKIEIVNKCKFEDCPLKTKGWHRHIYPLPPLSNILDSLSSKTEEAIKSVGTISNTIENNNRNKNRETSIVDNSSKGMQSIRSLVSSRGKKIIELEKSGKAGLVYNWQVLAFDYVDKLGIRWEKLDAKIKARWLSLFKRGNRGKLASALSFLVDYPKTLDSVGKIKLFFWRYGGGSVL